ncbi:MAG: TIGR01777 family oxidoreductase [Desulfatirhabdiaceae bacterium]
MKIFIAGGTGFVGASLAPLLLSGGHQLIVTGRHPSKNSVSHPHLTFLSADTSQPGSWQKELATVDAVINLAGAGIFRRWTESYKKTLLDSRVLTTRHIVEGLRESACTTLINASGVGFYGDRGDDILDETEPAGQDFLARLSRDWEFEALNAGSIGIRATVCRFGVILGYEGGALEQMVRPFKLFAGGPMGNGLQWFSWIHISDLTAGILYVLNDSTISGPVNFCSPNPVRNKDMSEILGRVLNRPDFLSTPAFVMKWVLGEFASVLLASQRAIPSVLRQHGFQFLFPTPDAAIRNLIRK